MSLLTCLLTTLDLIQSTLPTVTVKEPTVEHDISTFYNGNPFRLTFHKLWEDVVKNVGVNLDGNRVLFSKIFYLLT